jgi:alkylhydroperoxidase/carboxymuconolactone decarboxylase family protein YurZ
MPPRAAAGLVALGPAAPGARRGAEGAPVGELRTETVDTLRGLASAEPSVVEGLMGALRENLEDSGLDRRTHGLVRLAALIALDAPPPAYLRHVAAARDAGVTPEEILGALVAVGPLVGVPTVVRAARELSLALGLPVPPKPLGASGGDSPAGPGRAP